MPGLRCGEVLGAEAAVGCRSLLSVRCAAEIGPGPPAYRRTAGEFWCGSVRGSTRCQQPLPVGFADPRDQMGIAVLSQLAAEGSGNRAVMGS